MQMSGRQVSSPAVMSVRLNRRGGRVPCVRAVPEQIDIEAISQASRRARLIGSSVSITNQRCRLQSGAGQIQSSAAIYVPGHGYVDQRCRAFNCAVHLVRFMQAFGRQIGNGLVSLIQSSARQANLLAKYSRCRSFMTRHCLKA